MKPNLARLESIDVARGLAALSVVSYHQGYGYGLAQTSGLAVFAWIDWPGSWGAVPLFFVISGFCIHLGGLARAGSPHFVRDFFLLRFFRIYPAWVSAVAISALVVWLHGQPASGWDIFNHLILLNGFFGDYRLNPVLWSVSIECFLYLLYPLWFAFRRRYGLGPAFALGLVVSAVSSGLTARLQPVPTGPSMWFFLNVWCGWLAGAVLAERLRAPGANILRRRAWWIGGGVAMIAHGTCLAAGVYQGPAAYAALPLTIMLCIWPLSLLIAVGESFAARPPGALVGRGWRLLAQIGVFSYSLYLLHVPLQSFSFVAVAHLSATWGKVLVFAGWLGVVLLGSWLHYRWIEAPAVQWGRRFVMRLSSLPA